MAHANTTDTRPSRAGGGHTQRLAHGVIGNERLTAAAGGILFFLLAAQGLTLLSVGQFLTWHEFLGMTLIGPVTLKLGATSYRMVRYYTRDEEYVRRGAPNPFMRAIGPLLGLTTIAILGSGVGLYVEGRNVGPLLLVHKASFFLWAGLFAVHLLVHVWKVPGLVAKDLRRRHDQTTRRAPLRAAALVGSLAAGVLLASITIGTSASFDRHSAHRFHAAGTTRP